MPTRYYTDETYRLIKDTINSIQQTDIYPVSDFFSDLWNKAAQYIGFLKVDNYSNKIDSWYRTVLDSHNATVSKVDAIFEAVEDVDIQSASDLDNALDIIMNNRALINNLRSVISGSTSYDDAKALAENYYKIGSDKLNSLTKSINHRVSLHSQKYLFFSYLNVSKDLSMLITAFGIGHIPTVLIYAKSLKTKVLDAIKKRGSILAIIPLTIITVLSEIPGVKALKNTIVVKDILEYLSKQQADCLDSINLEGYAIMQTGRGEPDNLTHKANLSEFNEKAPDAEYLNLVIIAYDVEEMDGNRAELFAEELRKLPGANDPLKNVTSDQITYIHDFENGFSAFVISDGDSAVVVFPGTNGAGDVYADFQLGTGIGSKQAEYAIKLVSELKKTHSNITVTGHSLGGYLATSATLHNEGVDKCIAFDPPGRLTEGSLDSRYDASRASVVTTYENKGSVVSWVGESVGTEKTLESENGGWAHHSSKNMLEDMNGREEMEKVWGAPEYCAVSSPPEGINNQTDGESLYVGTLKGYRNDATNAYRNLIDDVENSHN